MSIIAVIVLKSPEPVELVLSSAKSVRFQIPDNHDPLWDNYASASPTMLVNRYLTETTQPKLTIADLPLSDLWVILSTALKREACQHTLDTNLTVDTLCCQFLELLLGIPQPNYVNKRHQLLSQLNTFAEKRLDLIDRLLGRNRREIDRVPSLQLHARAGEVRRERLRANIKHLELKKRFLSAELKRPDRTVGRMAAQEPSRRRFTLLDLVTDCGDLDPALLDYPYRWMSFLATPVYNELYRSWRAGNDIPAQLHEELQSPDFEEWLLNLAPQHEGIKRREPIIREALWSFRSERYFCTVALLLPQIEGLLWDVVEDVDRTKYPVLTPHPGEPPRKASFYQLDELGWYMENQVPILYCQNAAQADRLRLDVARDRKGRRRSVQKVSVLLMETGLKYHLYQDLFEHLAGELLQERNSVLHGEEVGFGTREQATKKILATAAVLKSFGTA